MFLLAVKSQSKPYGQLYVHISQWLRLGGVQTVAQGPFLAHEKILPERTLIFTEIILIL